MNETSHVPRDTNAISFPGSISSTDYFKREKEWSAREQMKGDAREKEKMWQEKTATYFCEKQNAGMSPARRLATCLRIDEKEEENSKR